MHRHSAKNTFDDSTSWQNFICHLQKCILRMTLQVLVDFKTTCLLPNLQFIFSSYFAQYVRVMAPNAQCSEDGPFFPTTARYTILMGVALDQEILKSPDWLVIFILLAAAFLAMVIMVLALVCNARSHWIKCMSFGLYVTTKLIG